MNALLVGDNSSNPNWGGRGASIALIEMLSKMFTISETISGSSFFPNIEGFGYVNTLLPAKYNSLFLYFRANRHRRNIYKYYVLLEEMFGAKDFIANDPVETVENILRYRGKYEKIQEVYDKVNKSEVIIINGEGDILFTTPPRREALFLLGMAQLGLRLNKKVVIVNALISDCPVTGRNHETLEYARKIFSQCSAVILRDYESFDYIKKEMPEVDSSIIPDSLFSWYPTIENSSPMLPDNGDFVLPFPENKDYFRKLNFSKPYICIGGSALAAKNKVKSGEYFSRLLENIRELGYPVYLTENCGGDSFFKTIAEKEGVGLVPVKTSIFMCGAILANARLFISGRYHPSILASLGGTPCIFLGSSAHKMRSLQKILEYEHIREFPVFPSSMEINEISDLAKEYLGRGESFREKIKAIAGRRYEEAIRLPEIIFEKIMFTK